MQPHTGLIAVAASLLVIAGTKASSQTLYTIPVTPIPTISIGSPYVTEKTSSGWVASNDYGASVRSTAHGLDLSFIPSYVGSNIEIVKYTNVADITGNGIQLDRYLSVTLGPENFPELAGSTDPWQFEMLAFQGSLRHEGFAGENFEIRTSLDNFAAPLITWGNRPYPQAEATYISPSLIDSSFEVFPTSYINTITSPIELRFYSWYDLPGGSGSPSLHGWSPDLLGAQNFSVAARFSVTPVPEPSSSLLTALAGLVLLCHRRRSMV